MPADVRRSARLDEATTYRAAGTLDLTVHVRDPDVPASARPARGDGSRYRATYAERENSAAMPELAVREWSGHAGATVCGKLMRLEELWVPHVPEDRDPICGPCRDGFYVGDDEDELFEWAEDDTPPPRPVHTVRVAGDLL